VSLHGPVARILAVVGLLGLGAVAAVGGLALRAPGVVAVGVAGLLAGLTAAAIAHDSPRQTWRSTAEAGVLGVAGTVGALLVVSGTAVLTGVAGTVAVVAVVAVGWLLRSWRPAGAARGGARRPRGPSSAADVVHLTIVVEPADGRAAGRTDPVSAEGTTGPGRLLPPVTGLSTADLGREWLRTTAALAARLEPVTRRAIVDRREATLDELERRDPAGFERWMASGPAPGSDPADFVRGGPVAGTEAA
jgi:hypothetical protein